MSVDALEKAPAYLETKLDLFDLVTEKAAGGRDTGDWYERPWLGCADEGYSELDLRRYRWANSLKPDVAATSSLAGLAVQNALGFRFFSQRAALDLQTLIETAEPRR